MPADELSILATSEVTESWSVASAARAKNAAVKQRNNSSKKGDTVSISAAAKEKYAAAKNSSESASTQAAQTDELAANGQAGDAASTASAHASKGKSGTVAAIKNAILQYAEESGLPRKGWGVGHYKAAYAASLESGDDSAMRAIFNSRLKGGAPAPVDPVTDPVVDPDGGEDPTGGLDPVVDPDGKEDPIGGLDPVGDPDAAVDPDADLIDSLLDGETENKSDDSALAA